MKKYDIEGQRRHSRSTAFSVFGRSYCYITCPFCGAEVQAFIWSLSGSGKKCDCGALHGSTGYSMQPIKTS